MTRPHVALAGLIAVFLLIPAANASAAWSTQQQVKGFLSERAPAIGVDETGTMALGLSTVFPSAGASYVERPPGLAEWKSAGVKITQITGALPSAVFALSPSGAAVVTWATGSSLDLRPWAAYKPPGGSWGAAFQIDTARSFEAPIPVIDAAGHAAVVWAQKATGASYLLTMPNEVVYSVPAGAGWTTATKLGDVTTPTPHDENPEGGFSFNGCPVDLRAAILPDGTPLAAWNDAYASWKLGGGGNDGFETALCSVRAASTGQVDVTPRPAVGWYAAPAAGMKSWTQFGLTASPTDTATAVSVRGLEDSLQIGGCVEGDACVKTQRETRVALGSGATLGLGGSNLIGINAVVAVALRHERALVVADSNATALQAGVGAGFPTLNALPEDFQLISAGLALSDAGAAHIAAIANNTMVGGLRLFDAPAAGAFAGPQVVDASSGATRTPALALDCKGLPVMAWSLSGSSQIWTSGFDTSPSVCGAGPQPEPEALPGGGGGSGGGSGPGTAPTGPTVVQSPPPVPSSLATIGKPDVDASGSKVSFQITCSPLTGDACNGKTVITKSNGGKARIAAKKAAVLGSVSFAGLKPGKSRTLKVPLVASAKQALKAGKSLKVVITATVRSGSGPAKVSTKAATLRLPAR